MQEMMQQLLDAIRRSMRSQAELCRSFKRMPELPDEQSALIDQALRDSARVLRCVEVYEATLQGKSSEAP